MPRGVPSQMTQANIKKLTRELVKMQKQYGVAPLTRLQRVASNEDIRKPLRKKPTTRRVRSFDSKLRQRAGQDYCRKNVKLTRTHHHLEKE